ncbi:dihydroxyacetone kinase subunit DhaL [Paracoccus sp. SY]|uniref:dihydroxyacetone kinase subunit DhaL n=1 Tax=Paracoccus sp. SY TaxID=1330255 RepID=UPI000CD117E5|nr:dihydroxyacetone kinase subunit DhaL [Paracoccus sp. SY]
MDGLDAQQLIALFRLISLRLDEARQMLGQLDGAIGDADHGNSMAEGFAAVVRASAQASSRGAGVGDLFAIAAESFLEAVGATTGPLYASAFLSAGQRYCGMQSLPTAHLPDLIPAFAMGIAERGKASAGDKTMLDAWAPAARAVVDAQAAGSAPLTVLDVALKAAEEGREATRAMIATVGRASRLGQRSLGHVDPGAASAVIIIAALRDGLALHLGQGAG